MAWKSSAQRCAYRKKNLTKIRARDHAYYRKNRAKILAWAKAYAKAHPKKIRSRWRKWYKANRSHVKANVKKWIAKNIKRSYANRRNHYLKKKYGITAADYEVIHKRQKGLCAICGRPERIVINGTRRRLAVDHDHRTNKVRGLICHDCNRGIGLFKDDPKRLMSAARYIRRHLRRCHK